MKKLLSIFALIMCVCTSYAQNNLYSSEGYFQSGGGGYVVCKPSYESGNNHSPLLLSSDKKTLIRVMSEGYSNNGFGHYILIPEGITTIAENALHINNYGRSYISVYLPSTIEYIAPNAFSEKVDLYSLDEFKYINYIEFKYTPLGKSTQTKAEQIKVESSAPDGYYNMNGQPMNEMQDGMNIVVQDGNTKKVIK